MVHPITGEYSITMAQIEMGIEMGTDLFKSSFLSNQAAESAEQAHAR